MQTIGGIANGAAAPQNLAELGKTMGGGTVRAIEQEGIFLYGTGTGPEVYREGNREFAGVWLGRLKNGPELRRELGCGGEVPEGELLLRAYARWETDCVRHLEGAFSAAIWDRSRRRLFLIRDHLGIQTLFWAVRGGELLFGSRISQILRCPGFRTAMDAQGAAELLLIGPGRTPGCGIFHGISELQPGCCAVWESGTLTQHVYWKLQDGPYDADFSETAEQVRAAVTDAIRRQTEPEGVGAFLSGGLDSGIVCSVASACCAEQGLDTFSVDYQGNDRYFVPGKFQPSSDPAYMGILEQALGTRPHRIVLTAQRLEEGLEDAVLARDLPGMGDVDISLLQLCREVRRTVPAVLSGECADELFGGYPWYRDPGIRSRAGFPWAQSTRQRAQLLHPVLARQVDAEAYVRTRWQETIRGTDILPDTPALERRMKELMQLNLTWFMQTLLERNRAMGAFAELEIRAPFCDRQLAELLYRVPWAAKEYGGMEKGLLRTAFRGLLPEQIRLRKKSPFPKTHDPDFLARMQRRLAQLLADREAPVWALVRADAAKELSDREEDWPFYGQLMRRPQTICYLLQLDFWLRHYGVNLLF